MIELELFWTFLQIGAFTFGGGYAMIPLIRSQVVAHGWMTDEALVNFLAVSESTPGPFAVNISSYVGAAAGGFSGAICATLGVILPSFAIILAVSKFLSAFHRNRLVKGAMSGLRPAVVGLIAAAVLSVGKTVLLPSGAGGIDWAAAGGSVFLFLLMLLAVSRKWHPIAVIAVSAALGIAGGLAGEALWISPS